MASKSGPTITFSEEVKLLSRELARQFRDVENTAYVRKITKASEEFFKWGYSF